MKGNRLFEPINIGTLRVPNRIVMPAIHTNYGDSLGNVTDRLIDYYVERAKNKVGLIIIELVGVAPGARVSPNQLYIHNDSYVPGLKKLASAIKDAGACCFLQLHHGGRRAVSKYNDGMQPVAPSAIPARNYEMPRALSLQDIEELIEAFAQGALRARQAGFDGVENHFAHGYLIAQFLSALTNKRTDKYGGDLESRARIGVEITRRIRQKVGRDFPLTIRICGDEYIKGGLTSKDTQKIAALMEKEGIDAINVSGGYTASHDEGYYNALIPWSLVPMSIPRGKYVPLAEGIKKIVKIPVMVVGRLDDPELAEKVVAEGKADLVCIGRGLLSDAAFASKVYNKQDKSIRRCIACCECLVTALLEGGLRCAINAEIGKEKEYQIKPAAKSKKVLVVGGGPGGMEAARVAALRGHKVTLVEKKSYLGGNMIPAAASSFKHDINLFKDYLIAEIRKLGVEILLNTEVDGKKIAAMKPDVVLLATGSVPKIPPIPGTGLSHVTDAIKVLEGTVKTGKRVVVAGGGSVGCELAADLAEAGKEVTVVEMRVTDFSDTDGLASDMNSILRRWFLFELWPTLPITVIGKSVFKEVTKEGLVIENREGEQRLIPADTVVFAAGLESCNGLKQKLEGKVPELYEIGDCTKPRKIMDAVTDAAKIARLI